MMNLSDDDFSSPQVGGDFVETDSLPLLKTGFHPKYDWRLNHQTKAAEEEVVEQPQDLSDDLLNQEITEAFAQGYLNGQQAAIIHQDQNDAAREVLAAALQRLKVVDEAKLAKPLWETVLMLFQKAVGHTKADRELMQRRCEAAIALLHEGIGDACLHVATSDADILQDHDCNIPVQIDSTLLPGSVRLTHEGGQVISGTIAITQAIESRIESAERGQC